MKKQLVVLSAVVFLCAFCASCGSSVLSQTSEYFSNVGSVLDRLVGRAGNITRQISEDGVQALDIPGNFSVSENGSFSFTGVENADYYLIYFCDPSATEDGDDYLYSSDPIRNVSAGEEFSGKFQDVIQYAYGEYLVKAFAFPSLEDTMYSMSGAAKASYTFSGKQDAPQITYYWNTFNGTLEMQLLNINNYLYQSYPDQLEITLTNTADPSDVLKLSIEDVSPENCSLVTEQITRGTTYHISALSISENPYVTNQVSDTTEVAASVTFGELSVMTPGFTYSDQVDGAHAFLYPRVCTDFPLTESGSAGTVPGIFGPYSFETTPATSLGGDSYTYDVQIGMTMFNSETIWEIEGILELREDGTLYLREYGVGPCPSSEIQGFWVDNGNGTATLCYDPSTVMVG